MKCQKCGFVSFDHLSECRKCKADLTAARQRLGFSALNAEAPFLLGSLLAGEDRNSNAKTGAGEELADVHFEYDSDPSLSDEADFEQPPGKPAIAAEKGPGPHESGEGGMMIELTEADLDALSGVEGDTVVKGRARDRR